MDFNMSDLDGKEKYRLLTSCIVPRPIAWVTTMNKAGILNAAPFSYFTGVSIEPPLVIFAVERRDGKKKDTIVNIEETNEFVVNLVTSHNVEKMNETSQDLPADTDELASFGLTTTKSKEIKVPGIKESPIQLECVCDQIIEVGSSPHSLVIGEVKVISVEDSFIEDGRVNQEKLEAVGRMGGKYYSKASDLMQLDRLDWRKNLI